MAGLNETSNHFFQISMGCQWDNKVKHEYHLVRGADHVGRTLTPRTKEALRFLARTLQPPSRDPAASASPNR